MPRYFAPKSKNLLMGAERLVSQQKNMNGDILRPSGMIRFENNFCYSGKATQELNDIGGSVTEADVINFIEDSPEFAQNKIIRIDEKTEKKIHASKARVQQLARTDDEAIPQDAIDAAAGDPLGTGEAATAEAGASG